MRGDDATTNAADVMGGLELAQVDKQVLRSKDRLGARRINPALVILIGSREIVLRCEGVALRLPRVGEAEAEKE